MTSEMIKSKTIKVLTQQHLVISKEYYDMLSISEDFAENLLEELIAAVFSAEELVNQFK